MLYGVASLFLLGSLTLSILREMKVYVLADLPGVLQKVPPIHWRTREQALVECVKAKKPILYVLLVQGTDFSSRLEHEGLCEPSVYRYINEQYIPVRLSTSLYRSEEERRADLGSSFNEWVRDGALLVVPYRLAHLPLEDSASSSNRCELGYPDNLKWGGSPSFEYAALNDRGGDSFFVRSSDILQSYQTTEQLLEFLAFGKIWHCLPPGRGCVNWQPVSSLEGKQFSKPRIAFMVDDIGRESDTMRSAYFYDEKLSKALNQSYCPVLLEYNRLDESKNVALNLYKRRYGISKLPAMVIVDSISGRPEVQRGVSFSPEPLTLLTERATALTKGVSYEHEPVVHLNERAAKTRQ